MAPTSNSPLAFERLLDVPGPLGDLIPGGGVPRGAVIGLEGPRGSGRTSLALSLAASATAEGSWAAVVGIEIGGLAAAEIGVDLEHLIVVHPSGSNSSDSNSRSNTSWPVVIAALLEAMALVVAAVPPGLSASDARRLIARARHHGSVLAVIGDWPAEVSLTLRAEGASWHGLDESGFLTQRTLAVSVTGRHVPVPLRAPALALAG